MRINQGFETWNHPYLFQQLEDILKNFSEEERSEVISLGIGDPDLPTPSAIRAAMSREHLTSYHGYPCVEGRIELRTALAEYYDRRFSVQTDPAEFLIGPGAKTDLFDLPAVFSNPGDSVIILDPAYPVYCDSATFRGLRIHFLNGTPQNEYRPALTDPARQDPSIAILFVCYPNNPTGAVATPEYLQQIIAFALSKQAVIIHDIAYADFTPGNTPSSGFSIFSLPGAEECAIEIGSFSKPFSMTGDRISWVLIKNTRMRTLWRRYRSNRDSGVSEFDQAGAIAALTDPDVLSAVRENMETYGRRARILQSGLAKLGLAPSGLSNTPYAWFKSPFPDSRFSTEFILKHARVLFTPGSGFGPGGEGFLRATIFKPESVISEAIVRMERIVPRLT